ncbi:alpha/beta-hydrolase [Flagelloscypha sp. PMI_526]|nr:alpha/beta-hydrolase [Flagelloscypha sp. PMI_526]
MLRSLVYLVCLVGLAFAVPIIEHELSKRAVSQSLFDELKNYFKYASSAYSITCPKPNGNTLVKLIKNVVTDTQGFIARDDTKKEIIVSMRGTSSVEDALTDVGFALAPLNIPGVSASCGVFSLWNSVTDEIVTTVGDQLAAHSGYSIVITGHSLGGALAGLAALTLAKHFPNAPRRVYTYGEPRTFNAVAADLVTSLYGDKGYRVVHTWDGVPTILPTAIGYKHHSTEYYLTFINPPHAIYFDILAITPFCS